MRFRASQREHWFRRVLLKELQNDLQPGLQRTVRCTFPATDRASLCKGAGSGCRQASKNRQHLPGSIGQEIHHLARHAVGQQRGGLALRTL